ncbi:MAG TPA: tetratricopeptide repeat protein [Ardenticatenaceae bacterium]|nr:tetratricopeptide repeat protein [Ardenticatenaceae bacterium]
MSSTNLFRHLTSFVGREREIAEIKRLIETTRLLTLTGAGGCGKSRLALRVAQDLLQEYPDGVWWVELAALSDPQLAPNVVASTLDVRERPGHSLVDTLSEFLTPRHVLLILDNCEHLVAACADLAERLLQDCPRLHILATSREPLGIAGEKIWLVPSLATPDAQHSLPFKELKQFEAVQLFNDRAKNALRTFELNEQNAAAVASVCHRLDGIPLAIEMAAARTTMLPVTQIAERLDDVFSLLAPGSRTVLPRHRTLRATLDWSYHLLSAQEQALLRHLSVFAGGFSLDAVEALFAESTSERSDVLDLLSRLVEKSLVVVMQREEGQAARYRLLDTVRQYAASKLDEAGEMERALDRHLNFFLHLAEQAKTALNGPGQGIWLARLEREHDNLRVALQRAKKQGALDRGVRMAGALWRFWYVRGYLIEGRRWLESMLEVYLSEASNPGDGSLAFALYGAAGLAWGQGDHSQAELWAEKALELSRELGDKGGIGGALNVLGLLALNRWQLAHAAALLEEKLAIARELDDRWEAAVALHNLASVAQGVGDYERANALQAESLAIKHELGNTAAIALSLTKLAEIACLQGDYERAANLCGESLPLHSETGGRPGTAHPLTRLAEVARAQGNYERATALHEECLVIYRDLGDTKGAGSALGKLGSVARAERDYDKAGRLYGESLTLLKRGIAPMEVAEYLLGLAVVASEQGQSVHAARFFGAAASVHEGRHLPVMPVDRAAYDRAEAATRAQLGAVKFQAAWAEGEAMSLDQVVALALAAPQGSPPLRQAAKQAFGGLTRREREIAALIAAGKSNREIAETLIVGITTVETHVTNILTKLGFASRVQVAAWAVEKGLV